MAAATPARFRQERVAELTCRDAFLGLIAASAFIGVAHAGCTLPPAPAKVPDGATATDPDMRAAMQTLKRYDADVSAYLKCLEFEVKQQRLSGAERARLHTLALEKLERATKLLNEQMQIYMGS